MSESDSDTAGEAGSNPESERAGSPRPTVPRRAMLKTGAAAGAAAAAFLFAPKIGGIGTASADRGQSGDDHGQAGDPPGQSGDASGPPAAAPGESASAPPHAIPLPERTETLHIHVDLGTFTVIPDGPGTNGPFHVLGVIRDGVDLADPIVGSYQCWGHIFDATTPGATVVTQEYDLTDRGKITVAGVEDSTARAVTGGTGEFRNVGGEMIADLSAFPGNPVFTAVFSLIG